VNGAVFILVED